MAKRMQVGFDLQTPLAKRLRRFAEDHDMTRSGALKLLVKEALDARETQAKRPRR